MNDKQEPTVYLKGYTADQVDHEILGKFYLAYVGTVRALERAVTGDFKTAYEVLDWAQWNLEEIKQRFPDLSQKATSFGEVLGEARNALGELEKKLVTK